MTVQPESRSLSDCVTPEQRSSLRARNLVEGGGDTSTKSYSMNLNFRPITADDVSTFTAWRYEPPYDIYNLPHPPQPDDFAEWLDPEIYCHGMWNQTDELIAFCTFGLDGQVPGGDYSTNALDIGMAVRPDHTGRGLGRSIAQSVIDFAQRTFDLPMLRVTIATFNQRAMAVWTGNDFEPKETFRSTTSNPREFQIFERTIK